MSLSMANEILEIEKRIDQLYVENDIAFKNNVKPMLEFQILEMERRFLNLADRLNDEAKIGLEHNSMLVEEYNAHKESLDDCRKRYYNPNSIYSFGGTDWGDVFIGFDDLWVEYANGHLYLKLLPGSTPSITLQMIHPEDNTMNNTSNHHQHHHKHNNKSKDKESSNQDKTKKHPANIHGFSINLRLDEFRLRSTDEAGLPKITFKKLEIQLSLNISIILKFIAKHDDNKQKNANMRNRSPNRHSSSPSSSHHSKAKKQAHKPTHSKTSKSSSKAKSKYKLDEDILLGSGDNGSWITSAKDFNIEILSFKGPYGIPRSLVSMVLTFATPHIRKAVVDNLPVEFGFFLQSLTCPFVSCGDFSMDGIVLPLLSTKLNATHLDTHTGDANQHPKTGYFSSFMKANTSVNPLPRLLGCSSVELDEFYVMQKQIYGNRVPLLRIEDIILYMRRHSNRGIAGCSVWESLVAAWDRYHLEYCRLREENAVSKYAVTQPISLGDMMCSLAPLLQKPIRFRYTLQNLKLEYSLNHLHRCVHLTLYRITSEKARSMVPQSKPKRKRKKGLVGAVVGGVGAVVGGVGAVGGAVVGGVVAVGGAVVDGVGVVGGAAVGAVGNAFTYMTQTENTENVEQSDVSEEICSDESSSSDDDADEFEHVNEHSQRLQLILKQISQSYTLGCLYLESMSQNVDSLELDLVSRMTTGPHGEMKATATNLYVKAPIYSQLMLSKNMTLFGYPLPVPCALSINGHSNGLIVLQVHEYVQSKKNKNNKQNTNYINNANSIQDTASNRTGDHHMVPSKSSFVKILSYSPEIKFVVANPLQTNNMQNKDASVKADPHKLSDTSSNAHSHISLNKLSKLNYRESFAMNYVPSPTNHRGVPRSSKIRNRGNDEGLSPLSDLIMSKEEYERTVAKNENESKTTLDMHSKKRTNLQNMEVFTISVGSTLEDRQQLKELRKKRIQHIMKNANQWVEIEAQLANADEKQEDFFEYYGIDVPRLAQIRENDKETAGIAPNAVCGANEQDTVHEHMDINTSPIPKRKTLLNSATALFTGKIQDKRLEDVEVRSEEPSIQNMKKTGFLNRVGNHTKSGLNAMSNKMHNIRKKHQDTYDVTDSRSESDSAEESDTANANTDMNDSAENEAKFNTNKGESIKSPINEHAKPMTRTDTEDVSEDRLSDVTTASSGCPVLIQTADNIKLQINVTKSILALEVPSLIHFVSKHYQDISKLRCFIRACFGLDFFDEELLVGKLLSDFVGKLLLKPHIHFHLRVSGKLQNTNNNIIATVFTPQYEQECEDNDTLHKQNVSNNTHNSNYLTNDDINLMLNYGFDEYTNTLLDDCLYKNVDSITNLNDRAINCSMKCCVMTILHDAMILKSELSDVMRYFTGKE